MAVQQGAALADKRLALQVLVFARAFADKDDLRVFHPHAKHHVVAGFGQRAVFTAQALLAKLLHAVFHMLPPFGFCNPFLESIIAHFLAGGKFVIILTILEKSTGSYYHKIRKRTGFSKECSV